MAIDVDKFTQILQLNNSKVKSSNSDVATTKNMPILGDLVCIPLIINRPGVAGAVLQTAPLLIH